MVWYTAIVGTVGHLYEVIDQYGVIHYMTPKQVEEWTYLLEVY